MMYIGTPHQLEAAWRECETTANQEHRDAILLQIANAGLQSLDLEPSRAPDLGSFVKPIRAWQKRATSQPDHETGVIAAAVAAADEHLASIARAEERLAARADELKRRYVEINDARLAVARAQFAVRQGTTDAAAAKGMLADLGALRMRLAALGAEYEAIRLDRAQAEERAARRFLERLDLSFPSVDAVLEAFGPRGEPRDAVEAGIMLVHARHRLLSVAETPERAAVLESLLIIKVRDPE